MYYAKTDTRFIVAPNHLQSVLQYVTTDAASPEGCDAAHYRRNKTPAVCAAVHNRSPQSSAVFPTFNVCAAYSTKLGLTQI